MGSTHEQVSTTPGHTAGHLRLWQPAEGLLVVGDALSDYHVGCVNLAPDGPMPRPPPGAALRRGDHRLRGGVAAVTARAWVVGTLTRVLMRSTRPRARFRPFFAPLLAAYAAVLLSNTLAPAWFDSRRELPFVLVGSAALASAGVQLVLTQTAQTGPARRLALIGVMTHLLAMHRLGEHLTELEIDELVRTGASGAKLWLAKTLTVAFGLETLFSRRSRPLPVPRR